MLGCLTIIFIGLSIILILVSIAELLGEGYFLLVVMCIGALLVLSHLRKNK